VSLNLARAVALAWYYYVVYSLIMFTVNYEYFDDSAEFSSAWCESSIEFDTRTDAQSFIDSRSLAEPRAINFQLVDSPVAPTRRPGW
jgi:hypothetical protein